MPQNQPMFSIVMVMVMHTAGGKPLFAVPENALAAQQILHALRGDAFHLFGYTILPDHLRVLLQPKDSQTFAAVLTAIRKSIARALAARKVFGNILAPKSEIRKVWNGSALQAARADIQGAPVTAGLAKDAVSFPYSSAHPDAEVDGIETSERVPRPA